MFDCLLIANRGEITCRIIRTARRLGIETVAVHSSVDAGAQHVLQADRAVEIGGAAPAESYLDIERVISAALETGAQAVHPGYGFLSENAAFARACADAGLVFVGPSAEAIAAMGSKIEAKRLVAGAGTAVVPGYDGADQDDTALAAAARDVGFPLLVKASAGGGGKGMRIVPAESEFLAALAAARREARGAFGDDRVLLERYLRAPKHIEVQILADAHGNTLHLFERDCSVQRRHQKVIEEAPAPGIDGPARQALGDAAVRAARAIDYVGAGTVEFIAEEGEFYFMEMNTRLQVEHPVTEAITGLDLVEWQLRIAAGEVLPFAQDSLAPAGHAIEARIYAENPRRDFLPSTGRLERLSFPVDARVDTGVVEGDTITPYYDPMIAKLIVAGEDRQAALGALARALADVRIAGIEHNVAYLGAVARHPAFQSGAYTTRLADDHHDELLTDEGAPDAAVCAAAALRYMRATNDPWGRGDGFRVNLPGGYAVSLRINDEDVNVTLGEREVLVGGDVRELNALGAVDDHMRVTIDGRRIRADVLVDESAVHVMVGGATYRFGVNVLETSRFEETAASEGQLHAPMPGQVVSVAVVPGTTVEQDAVLVVIEAMKMEHAIRAPFAGTVEAVHFEPGDRVEEGAELVTLNPADEE